MISEPTCCRETRTERCGQAAEFGGGGGGGDRAAAAAACLPVSQCFVDGHSRRLEADKMAEKAEATTAATAPGVNGAEATDKGASAGAPGTDNQAVKEMRCVTLTGFGGVRMVKVQKRPEVKPIEGEVLIRVKAW